MVQSWHLSPTILSSNHDFSSYGELREIKRNVNVEEFQCLPPTNPNAHPLARLPNEIQDLILEKLPRHTRIKYCLLSHAAFHAVQSRTAIIWQGRRGLYHLSRHLDGLSTVIWRGGDLDNAPNFTTFKYAPIDLLRVSSKVRYLGLVRVHELSQGLIRFMIDSIGLESNYPNSILELNGKTDLHFKLEILPYDARRWHGRGFNSIGKFPYISRLQRYLPHLIRDHPELIREDTDFRRNFLDAEGNGRKRVPAEMVHEPIRVLQVRGRLARGMFLQAGDGQIPPWRVRHLHGVR
ncbi:hypothetical protein VTN00DRAFT_8842 [Thermoascus crustaceus]|uniref:uncharacterized protein n=1 Tax=Thermoascus crustaceus TaxID=5088 RepID=UPI003742AC22